MDIKITKNGSMVTAEAPLSGDREAARIELRTALADAGVNPETISYGLVGCYGGAVVHTLQASGYLN